MLESNYADVAKGSSVMNDTNTLYIPLSIWQLTILYNYIGVFI